MIYNFRNRRNPGFEVMKELSTGQNQLTNEGRGVLQ